ncbi:MAG TPA: family 43 glycosylhydrolase, partial [Candidatus Sumerlaeota bacterium]|nr:family 43 glycosylhydrolase [Candidatus Sumerlaeota bacterium]
MQNTCLSKIRPSVTAFLTGGRLFAWTLLCLFGILAGGRAGISSAHAASEDTRFDAPGNFNPIVPGYFADPTIRKFGDLYYLYATTDGNGGGRGPSQVWVSKDFVNWTLVPMNWPKTPYYWAPDVLKHTDGRYYLYYNQPCITFCGVSDSPIGPWTPLIGEDGLLIEDKKVPNVITLDTQSFVDKDGSIYLYWGTWGIYPNSGCGVGKLNPDMKTFAKLGKIPNTQAKDFFEAPFMLERNGLYYFTYSSGSCHDGTYRVQYAVGDRPDGDFKMGPNNPILASNADDTVNGPGHHSILKENQDDYFIVYHRHDIPLTPNGMHRQVCADRMQFGAEGEILKVEPTHRGIGYLGNTPKRSPNLTTGKPVRASSYRDTVRNHEYKPEYAVDDNNATLWRPVANKLGASLDVDLVTPQRIRRTETQFEYATWYYQYLIEYSTDAKEWKTFADRRNNLRWGSPMVDKGDVEARYLRITITGTEYPGLAGAIWNFKAFSDAPDDPLEEMAARAFEQVVGAEREKKKSEAEYLSRMGYSCDPLISLDVSDFQLGDTVSSWKNKGTLGGEFGADEAKPRVELAGGCKAMRFSGNQILKASFTGPRALSGNNSFTVSA